MPKSLALTFALALLTAGFCQRLDASADARIAVTLEEKAVVSDGVIRLSDVAVVREGAPAEVTHLALGNSPWPGQVRRVSRVLLKVRLVSAGFDLSQFEFKGGDACLVELASLRIEPQQIVAAARRHLEAQFSADGPTVEIELLREVAPVLVPAAGGDAELRPALYGDGPPVGNVRVDVEVVRDGACLRKVPVGFSVKLHERVAVAVRQIGSGEPLTRANVTFVRRNISTVSESCVRSAEELAGQVAARSIRAGQTITRRMVAQAEEPLVIDLNQRVFLVVETETLRAVTLGKSLCRARKGDVARARNLSTGREVVGLALDNSTIQVLLEGR